MAATRRSATATPAARSATAPRSNDRRRRSNGLVPPLPATTTSPATTLQPATVAAVYTESEPPAPGRTSHVRRQPLDHVRLASIGATFTPAASRGPSSSSSSSSASSSSASHSSTSPSPSSASSSSASSSSASTSSSSASSSRTSSSPSRSGRVIAPRCTGHAARHSVCHCCSVPRPGPLGTDRARPRAPFSRQF
jgi:hypothetical protein